MINISFIGNQNVEFASRWKRELVPEHIYWGNDAAKSISIRGGKIDNIDKIIFNKRNRETRKIKEILNINKDSIINDFDNKIYKSNKISLSAKGQEKLKKLKSAYKKRKFTANIGKAKKFISKNKLGLGAVGLATAGAIGYGLIRKMRSDKGKKRGFYSK